MKKQVIIGIGLLVATLGGWKFFHHQGPQKVHTQVPKVRIAKAIQKDLPLEIKLPGVLSAEETVLVKPRVDGYIKKIHFKEGDLVQQGQLLFTLDDNELQAQIKEAEASLDKVKSQYKRAQLEVERQRKLVKNKFIPQARFDDLVTNVSTLQADQKNFEGALELLNVRLGYTKIVSPLTGIAGFTKVDEGNLVHVSDNNPLVSVVKVDPLETIVQLPEKHMKYLAAAKDLKQLKVTLLDLEEKPLPYPSWIDSYDNTINATTGTLGVKIKIQNPLENNRPKLLAGEYINAQIQLTTLKDSVVVPLNAVQTGQKGTSVFVCDAQTKTVRQQPITLAYTTHEEAVIAEGIKVGQQVVTTGQLMLRDGITVAVIP